jgi:hypothetical protein
VKADERIQSPFFRVGEPVPESGIYRVFHPEHRVSHEVTLVGGQDFPRCSHCGANVHFELLHSAPGIDQDPNFSTRRLYEIPHPDDSTEQQERRTA